MEWFAGSLLHWPLTSADTDGTLALGHAVVRPGGEPPLHVHAREDEIFYVLDGEITFQRGTERVDARAGDSVFMPRGVQHGFAVRTETASLLQVFTPGGLEEAFRSLSQPAPAAELPPAPELVARLAPGGSVMITQAIDPQCPRRYRISKVWVLPSASGGIASTVQSAPGITIVGKAAQSAPPKQPPPAPPAAQWTPGQLDEMARQRKRLGPLTTEQEAAIEALLMSTVNKISHPILSQMRRFYETSETDDPKDFEE